MMHTMSVPTRDPVPPTEVTPKAQRATFTAEYKRGILREADRCSTPGAVAALLRREGLSSILSDWRRSRDRGEFGVDSKRRGPVPKPAPDARDERIAELERENVKLAKRARRAEAMVELQKKVTALLATMDADAPSETP